VRNGLREALRSSRFPGPKKGKKDIEKNVKREENKEPSKGGFRVGIETLEGELQREEEGGLVRRLPGPNFY